MFELGDVLSKEMYCNSNVLLTGVWGRIFQQLYAMGSWGEAPSRLAIFRNF